jgi:heat shock protein HslJ
MPTSMLRGLPLALCALALLATGCGGADDDAVTSDQLAGRTFAAETVDGHDLVEGSQLTFTFESGALAFDAGCNRMAGSTEMAGGRLRLTDDPVSTMMSCGSARDAQDRWLAQLLTDGVRVTQRDGTLALDADGVTIPLRETDLQTGQRQITDTTWTLKAIGDRDGGRTAVPAGVRPPTLRLSAGQSELFTGCNSGGGSAELTDDGFVVFGPQRLTMMACTEPGSQEVEQAMTAVLDGKAALAFEGDDLLVMKDGRSLLFAAG